MAIGHLIRQGDKTTCGGTVLEGDTAFTLDGMPRSSEGDQVSCGKDGKTYVIVGGISYFTSDGRLAAGSLDSHSSCPCKAGLIHSALHATYHSSNDVAPPATRAVAQPASQPDRSATTQSRLANPKHAEPTHSPVSNLGTADAAACNHPDLMEELATYIAGEMNRNIKLPAVLKMKELLNYDSNAAVIKFLGRPWYARLVGRPDFNTIAWTKRLEAMAIWTKQVGQNMEWDHKPKLQTMYNGVWHKQGKYEYFYDIWSNIHYGYVGVAGGLSESVLLDGAGIEQIGSDLYRQVRDPERFSGPRKTEGVEGMRAWDDIPDRVSIVIGMNLYKEYPNGGLTAKIIMDSVLAVPVREWAKGIQEHVCK